VDETTATLPTGWIERLVPIKNENTGGATGWCLEVHDLAVAKLVAGREKDVDFVRVLLHERMVGSETLATLLRSIRARELLIPMKCSCPVSGPHWPSRGRLRTFAAVAFQASCCSCVRRVL